MIGDIVIPFLAAAEGARNVVEHIKYEVLKWARQYINSLPAFERTSQSPSKTTKQNTKNDAKATKEKHAPDNQHCNTRFVSVLKNFKKARYRHLQIRAVGLCMTRNKKFF